MATPGASSRQAALKALIRRMADKDQAAAATLYDQSCETLYALALRIVMNAEDAEEILHDVYCRAWRNANSYDESRGLVMSWLVLMTRSIAGDLVRSKRRGQSLAIYEVMADDVASCEHSPETQATNIETTTKIRARSIVCHSNRERWLNSRSSAGSAIPSSRNISACL